MEPRAEFADYVDAAGRFVRHWTYGSGHRPLMEISTEREAFDPPFESGEVLVDVIRANNRVTLRAPSEKRWREVVAELALGMIEIDRMRVGAAHIIGGQGDAQV